MKLFGISLIITLFNSCALLDRRDYEDHFRKNMGEDYMKPGVSFDVTPGDPVDYFYDHRREVFNRSNALKSYKADHDYWLDRERDEKASEITDPYIKSVYMSMKKHFEDISHEIYFLTLPDQEKVNYARSVGVEVYSYQSRGQSRQPASRSTSSYNSLPTNDSNGFFSGHERLKSQDACQALFCL